MNSARTAVADSYLSDLHEVGAEGSGESILLARRAAVSAPRFQDLGLSRRQRSAALVPVAFAVLLRPRRKANR